MSDLNCPYCDASLEVCHDDGFGYGESEHHQMECSECEKTFTFQTSIHFYYEPAKADCLNGEPHQMEPVLHMPKYYPDWQRCKTCDHEVRGALTHPTPED